MKAICNECAFHRSYSQDLVEYIWTLEAIIRSDRRLLITSCSVHIFAGLFMLWSFW